MQDYGVFPKELPNIYKAAIERLQKRFNHAEKGFTDADVEAVKTVRYVRYTEGVALDETTLAFFICLFLEPKYAFRFLNGLQAIQSPDTAEGRATQWSFAMFCCRLPQPKLESSDIMLDMLNELGKCPDPLYRVLSEADKKQFDRSVLRVPKDAALETPDLTPDTEGSDNKVQMKRHETNRKEEAFDDRFAYFALRYFDDKNVFPTLRFQLQLAKFTKEKYRKVIYREEQDRLLQKPIRLFGKYAPYRHLYDKVNQDNLQKRVIDTNYVAQFPETWRMETDGVTVLRPEIDQFSPHYNISEGTIGFKFIQNASLNTHFPNLPKDDTEKLRHNEVPDAVISVYELKNLFLYSYLHIDPKNSAERFVRNYTNRFKIFIKDVKNGTFPPLMTPPDYAKDYNPFVKDNPDATRENRKVYCQQLKDMEARRDALRAALALPKYQIPYNAVPDDIREYLLAYQPPHYVKEVKKIFAAQKDFVTKQLAKIKAYQQDTNEDKKRVFNSGELATWLAEDIVSLMPPRNHIVNGVSHDQKINNDQYRTLQASLAYFSVNKVQIGQYFEELRLTQPDSATRHPFLKDINLNNCTGVLHFYQTYLERKQRWLKEVSGFVSNNTKQPQRIDDKYGYLLPMACPKNKKEAIDKMRNKDYSQIPVFLPRGLFNEAIVNTLSQKLGLTDKDNAAFALDKLMQSDTQPFYHLPHYIFEKDKNAPNTEGVKTYIGDYLRSIKEEIADLESEKKDYGLSQEDKYRLKDLKKQERQAFDRERLIRYIQSTDRSLWLMVKERAKTEHTQIQDANLKLANIDKVLDISVDMSITIHGREIIGTLPIRRYGDLRRIAKDSRLEDLVKYYPEGQPILYETIEKEFNRYDERREAFFEDNYQFEKTLFKQLEPKFPPMVNGVYDHEAFKHARSETVKSNEEKIRSYYSHNVFLDIATDELADATLKDKYKNDVVMLRNKFLHNQVPCWDDKKPTLLAWLPADIAAETDTLFVDKIFNIAERYYADLLKTIFPT